MEENTFLKQPLTRQEVARVYATQKKKSIENQVSTLQQERKDKESVVKQYLAQTTNLFLSTDEVYLKLKESVKLINECNPKSNISLLVSYGVLYPDFDTRESTLSLIQKIKEHNDLDPNKFGIESYLRIDTSRLVNCTNCWIKAIYNIGDSNTNSTVYGGCSTAFKIDSIGDIDRLKAINNELEDLHNEYKIDWEEEYHNALVAQALSTMGSEQIGISTLPTIKLLGE
jgi:hypothetical protein